MSTAHRDYFNALASEWSVRMPDDSRFRELLMNFAVSSGDRVLDAGAGTGRMTKHLIELAGATGCIVAQDFAFYMLKEGQYQLSDPRVQWVCDDLCELSLKSNFFDKVLCFSVFPHLRDPQLALKEIHRVLRPGGKMLILHFMSSILLNNFHASLHGVVSQDRLAPATEMARLLKSVGFIQISHHEDDALYHVQGMKPVSVIRNPSNSDK